MILDNRDEAPDRLLRATDIQRELGVSRATAYRMMTDGTLPVYRFGSRAGKRSMLRVSSKDLRSWREARRAAPKFIVESDRQSAM